MTFTVGVNAPGYLPDTDPVECATWAEALETLKADLSLTWDSLMPDATDHTPHNDAHAEANGAQPGKAFSVYLVGLCHWIEKA